MHVFNVGEIDGRVSISVKIEGLGIGIVRIKFVLYVGVSVTELVRIPRPQCKARVKKIFLYNFSIEKLLVKCR